MSPIFSTALLLNAALALASPVTERACSTISGVTHTFYGYYTPLFDYIKYFKANSNTGTRTIAHRGQARLTIAVVATTLPEVLFKSPMAFATDLSFGGC